MRIRTSRICPFLGVAIVGASAVALAGCVSHGDDATATPDTTSPRAVVERFFHWYVSERNLDRDPMSRAALQTNADVTPEFISSMETVAAGGRDPMLCSGEIPHASEIGEPSQSGTSARVSVGGADPGAAHGAWWVDLGQVGSVWRIVAISCALGAQP